MARNKLAGTKTGKSKSSQWYYDNPDGATKKNAYNTKYHSTLERIKYRAGLNKTNHDKNNYGNDDKLDESHNKDGSTSTEPQSKNRKRNRSKRRKGGRCYPSLPKH